VELELRRAAAGVFGDQRVDDVELVTAARRALQVVEDADRYRGVGRAEPGAVLANAAVELLDRVAAPKDESLRPALADRDRDDAVDEQDRRDDETDPREPGASQERAPGAGGNRGQPATAL
jgi:hypothetical protein